ncbi:nucleotide sugar dehydrogenase [Pedococcus sp. 5OH_020]|uniref:nucleotide sugar dehydrogenase n=1 Tax=Pedococcus sp. 5OH_020 TaxID=2989814 RepID=UPI0022E9C3ED|nr:nucleotide sugar dehydrogenase [Pedococcus sp. 5OH_020]
MKVAVFGLGYVGTVTAAGLASRGHEVVGVDVDTLKVDMVRRGQSPVVEPGIDLLVRDAVAGGRLDATTDARLALERADVSLVCVGTPSSPRGDTDLTYIKRALSDLRDAMEVAEPPSGVHSVVIRSTVPPGTCATVVAPVFAAQDLPQGWSVGTAMTPEFLREGCGVEDFFAPPFVVVGTQDARTREALTELFAFLGQEIHHVDLATAEALKYACNAFHAVKVTFANEMGRVFAPFGVDARRVMEIFTEDRKLNIAPTYLRPGFAFGGSCLPKDLRALQTMARYAGVEIPMVGSAMVSNEILVRSVVDRVLQSGYQRVCLLGLSFKMDTDDLRESPNLEVAERFVGKGLDVRIYDPIVNPDRLVGANLRHLQSKLAHVNRLLATTPQEALDGAEVVVVASSDPAGLEALKAADPRLVIDLNGRLGIDVERLEPYQGVSW